MSRTIQSTQQLRGSQIPQDARKKAQSGSALPGGSKKIMKNSKK
jgi:hypothetical protein